MRLIALTILMLMAGCETLRPGAPAPVAAVCNPDLPAEAATPATWAWLDANDPAFAARIDRANAREICTCPADRAALSAEDRAAICGAAP